MITDFLDNILDRLGSLNQIKNVNSTISIILRILEKHPDRINELLPILRNQNEILSSWIAEHQLHEDIEEDVFDI
jgi:hypothetical protein